MLPLFTLYNVAQCLGKNDRGEAGHILGCRNGNEDPKAAGGKQQMWVLHNVGNALLPQQEIEDGR